MEQTIKWHYIAEEGLPKIKDGRSHAFLICDRVELADVLECNDGHKIQVPNGKYLEVCTVALIQKNEEHRGSAYTPAMKFYWGPDIFDNVYAWAEIPKAIPFKKKITREE